MWKIVMTVLLILVVLVVAAGFWVSQPVFDETRVAVVPSIASPHEALTFARTADGLILVSDHTADAIRGINLTPLYGQDKTASIGALLTDVDRSELVALAVEGQEFPLSLLQMPADYQLPYVAAGTNFKEHAEEVYSDDPPFLFPKLTAAGAWNDPVPFVPRLDYEAELCVFPLTDIRAGESLPEFGLLLCNDFTDRWTLVSELDLSRPLGETGFASGKGCAACMPTGYLVVVPESPDFYLSLSLSLYVNEQLRQRFDMREIILPLDEIVSQALDQFDLDYQKGTETITLLPEKVIPQGTLILTGTAAGVIFKPLNIWNQGFYLKQGDIVRTQADFLGYLENEVVN